MELTMPYRIPSPFTHQKIGRRGACLLIFGFVPAMIGASLFLQPADRHGQSRVVPILGLIAPDLFWATVWSVLGVSAMICSFFGWRAMRVGYVLAYSLPMIWGAADFVSWAAGDLPTGWVACFIYLGYSLLVVIVSGWDEPGERLELGTEKEVHDA
jgi:hypothetical protein